MDITAQSGDEREKNDEINRKNGRIYEWSDWRKNGTGLSGKRRTKIWCVQWRTGACALKRAAEITKRTGKDIIRLCNRGS